MTFKTWLISKLVGKEDYSSFRVFTDRAGEYRFNIVAGNGEIVASSEGYKSMAGLKKGIQAIRKAVLKTL